MASRASSRSLGLKEEGKEEAGGGTSKKDWVGRLGYRSTDGGMELVSHNWFIRCPHVQDNHCNPNIIIY